MASSILQTVPILVAMGAALFGRQVGWRRWSAIELGFGVLIIMQPEFEG